MGLGSNQFAPPKSVAPSILSCVLLGFLLGISKGSEVASDNW